MSSVDSTALASTPITNPATSASAQPSASAAPPAVTPAAAAASPATSLLSGIPLSVLPLAQAASLVDWLDVMLQAHPWAAPLLYVGIAYGLQRYNDGTMVENFDRSVVTRWSPHQLQLTAFAVFTVGLVAFKTIHTRGLQWIPTSLQFLIGGDATGLSAITPLVSRFFYTQVISYPLVAYGTIALLPNQPPVQGAAIAAGVMMLPLLYALGVSVLKPKQTAVPAATSVG